jgi:hypothetical protein
LGIDAPFIQRPPRIIRDRPGPFDVPLRVIRDRPDPFGVRRVLSLIVPVHSAPTRTLSLIAPVHSASTARHPTTTALRSPIGWGHSPSIRSIRPRPQTIRGPPAAIRHLVAARSPSLGVIGKALHAIRRPPGSLARFLAPFDVHPARPVA